MKNMKFMSLLFVVAALATNVNAGDFARGAASKAAGAIVPVAKGFGTLALTAGAGYSAVKGVQDLKERVWPTAAPMATKAEVEALNAQVAELNKNVTALMVALFDNAGVRSDNAKFKVAILEATTPMATAFKKAQEDARLEAERLVHEEEAKKAEAERLAKEEEEKAQAAKLAQEAMEQQSATQAPGTPKGK